MSLFPKRTPGASAPNTTTARKVRDAIAAAHAPLADAAARRRAAVHVLTAEAEAAEAESQAAQRAYARALADAAATGAPPPPAPGAALARAAGLRAAIAEAETLVCEAEAAATPAGERLRDAQDALDCAELLAVRAEADAAIAAVLPVIARLCTATLRCQAAWYMPDLTKAMREWEHAQGTAEPLSGR